jgi:4-amino-4-deoxy-L-arabinose transferase-like glycosyltransferase
MNLLTNDNHRNATTTPRSRWPVAYLVGLLTLHAGMLAWSATRHSPTLNEPAHLAAGIFHWQFGKFDLYRVNPPLVRLLAALPALALGVETDWSEFSDAAGVRPDFEVGREFVSANGERTLWLVVYARWSCIAFSLLGAVVCFLWARDAYGNAAGMLAATLWCFSPEVLGHGQLITPDVAAAALGAAAMYAYWRWLLAPGWRRTVVAGVVLGVALLTKTMLIILLPLGLAFWLMAERRRCRDGRRWPLGRLAMLGAQWALAIYVLNLGYFFDRPWTRLGEFPFVSTSLAGDRVEGQAAGNRFAGTWLGRAPVPLPYSYVLGIDVQKQDFEDFGRPSYLRGRFQDRGWWYYYLYATLVKVPVGLWALMLITARMRLPARGGQRVAEETSRSATDTHCDAAANGWITEWVLLGTPAAILALISSQTGFSHHFRYALPALPMLLVWTSQIAETIRRSKSPAALPALCATAMALTSSAFVYPHSLSYFNELAGGPRRGHDHLINSNIDWGQDLWALKRWLAAHGPDRPLRMAYDGYFDAAALGVEFALPPQRSRVEGDEIVLEPALYAVSVNFLRGYPFGLSTGEGGMGYAEAHDFSYFRQLKPTRLVGYSIYLYDVRSKLRVRAGGAD